jgi:hypothetical protein
VESSEGREVESFPGEEGEKVGKEGERCAWSPCAAARIVLTNTAVDSKITEEPAEIKEKEVCCDALSLNWTCLLTYLTVSCSEVRAVGSIIGYGAQVNPLRQRDPSGKVSSVFCLAVAEILT